MTDTEIEALVFVYDELRRLGGFGWRWWWRRQVDRRWREALAGLGVAADRFERSLAEMRKRGDLPP